MVHSKSTLYFESDGCLRDTRMTPAADFWLKTELQKKIKENKETYETYRASKKD